LEATAVAGSPIRGLVMRSELWTDKPGNVRIVTGV
jgi:hypothetical protein